MPIAYCMHTSIVICIIHMNLMPCSSLPNSFYRSALHYLQYLPTYVYTFRTYSCEMSDMTSNMAYLPDFATYPDFGTYPNLMKHCDATMDWIFQNLPFIFLNLRWMR